MIVGTMGPREKVLNDMYNALGDLTMLIRAYEQEIYLVESILGSTTSPMNDLVEEYSGSKKRLRELQEDYSYILKEIQSIKENTTLYH